MKKRCYTYEELGPTVDVQLNKEIVKISVGKASNGWSYDPYYEQVATVLSKNNQARVLWNTCLVVRCY